MVPHGTSFLDSKNLFTGQDTFTLLLSMNVNESFSAMQKRKRKRKLSVIVVIFSLTVFTSLPFSFGVNGPLRAAFTE